jgi:hypothetical protein
MQKPCLVTTERTSVSWFTRIPTTLPRNPRPECAVNCIHGRLTGRKSIPPATLALAWIREVRWHIRS